MTYTSFHEHTFSMSSNSEVAAYITNYDLISSTRGLFLKGSTASALINANPIAAEIQTIVYVANGALTNHENFERRVDVIPLGKGSELLAQLRVFSDSAITDAYLKARVVGAGTRLFRTSKTESESGTADVIYA